MGRGARVERVRRLGGGIAQATHALSIVDASGAAREVVLQQWTRPGWEVEDPGFGPAKEAAVLGALAGGPVPVPEVIAVDADGDETGSPALLMGRLPGRPPTVAQVLRRETVATLAETLVALHRLAAERWSPELVAIVPAYHAFGDMASTVIPANRRRPDLWAEAVRIASQPPPRTRSILIHRDFHAGNTLWL
ncbi:MAG TPA: phosphotransferase, partial [Candidatus Limnocylindrales bacterium]|nr:phosphotransferase [Candidatus Limnocylindrales bacterium]